MAFDMSSASSRSKPTSPHATLRYRSLRVFVRFHRTPRANPLKLKLSRRGTTVASSIVGPPSRTDNAMEQTTTNPGNRSDSSKGGSTVVSLADARHRRPRQIKRASARPAPDALDLVGLDLDRMSHGARELYWFNVNRYSRRLFLAASDASIMSARSPYAEIGAEHVQRAEDWRRRHERRNTHRLGAAFVLDALLIVGAAVSGALATRPDFIVDAGAYPLAAAVTMTAALFLIKEWMTATE